MKAIKLDKQDIIYLLKGVGVPYELLSKMPNDIGSIGSCGHNDPCWCWKRDIESYNNYTEEQLYDLYCQIKQFRADKNKRNVPK